MQFTQHFRRNTCPRRSPQRPVHAAAGLVADSVDSVAHMYSSYLIDVLMSAHFLDETYPRLVVDLGHKNNSAYINCATPWIAQKKSAALVNFSKMLTPQISTRRAMDMQQCVNNAPKSAFKNGARRKHRRPRPCTFPVTPKTKIALMKPKKPCA